MKKIINLKKGLNRNIYNISLLKDIEIFDLCLALLASSFLAGIIENFFTNAFIINITMFILYIIFTGAKKYYICNSRVIPYRSTKQFIGLYSIEGSSPIKANFNNGLISRKEELMYLCNIIECVFKETKINRGICITGKSGCGKSTILNLFENNFMNKYKIYNFSEKYDFLEDYIIDEFGVDYKKYLFNNNNKIVIIFDQFERFFALNEKKRKNISQIIHNIAAPQVAIVFSIREEFFLPLTFCFNLNDLNKKYEEDIEYHGIMAYQKQLGQINASPQNIIICLDDEGYLSSNKQLIDRHMHRLCIQAFGSDNGELIYEKYKNKTLIQQQIIFNVLKNEKDYYRDYMNYIQYDVNYIMKRFYDVQLCSTGDYFNASRIMYLLSLGRINNIVFSLDNILDALCIRNNKNDMESFGKCIKILHELELIKETKDNCEENYEISHDYIAKSFEIYANTEIPSNVKAAIDEYKSEFIRKTSIVSKMKKYRESQKKSKGALLILILSVLIDIGWYLTCTKYFNHRVSLSVLAISITSLLYVYNFFSNITRYYERKWKILIKLFYFCSMLSGVLSIIFYDFWLRFLGIGNVLLGISCIVIGCDTFIANMGRKMFLSYGVKTFIMGSLLILYTILLGKVSITGEFFIDIKLIMQVIPMSALIIYSYFSHINKEFFYSHLEAIFSCNE